MNKNSVNKNWDVLEGFKNGKIVQFRSNTKNDWVDIENPSFDSGTEYRLKPEPRYIPFTFEDRELFRNKWVVLYDELSGGTIEESLIIDIDKHGISVFSGGYITYKNLFEEYKFLDGTPCGKFVV